MNKVIISAFIIILMLLSCGEKEKIVEVPVATPCRPSPPRGIYSINLDGYVTVCWYANPEGENIVEYLVYWAEEGDEYYSDLGSVQVIDPEPSEYCYDDEWTENGTQYYYAIAAKNRSGLISEPSYEVTGTPRPEGLITLYEHLLIPEQSGYDLSGFSNSPQRDSLPNTDFFFAFEDGRREFIAYRSGVDIQDYGFVEGFDYINYAPVEGWSNSRKVEAIAGHCYMLRLLEMDGHHYVKLFITEITVEFVTFWWAYQTDPGNRDLAPPPPDGDGEGAIVGRPHLKGSGSRVDVKRRMNSGRQYPPSFQEGNHDAKDDS